MSGLLTALRGNGRTSGLVRKGRNKMHVASLGDGDSHWLTVCDRDVIVAGTKFAADAEAAGLDEDQLHHVMCVYCLRFMIMATLIVRGFSAAPRAAGNPKVWDRSA